jgi:hypothetical protein
MGPSTYTRNAEITSGRAISQQGLATTCRDPSARGTGVDGRVLVWRMSPYERRRRGNALRDGTRGRPLRGNASQGQRGSRRRAGRDEAAERSIDSEQSGRLFSAEMRSQPSGRGVYVCQRLSFSLLGKAPRGNARVANRTREIRPSGMKTGARGNVTHGEPRNPTRNRKGGLGHSSPTGARASVLSKQTRPARGEPTRAGSEPCDGLGNEIGEA